MTIATLSCPIIFECSFLNARDKFRLHNSFSEDIIFCSESPSAKALCLFIFNKTSTTRMLVKEFSNIFNMQYKQLITVIQAGPMNM